MKPSPRFGAVALLLAASLGCRALSGGTANVPTYDAKTFFASTTIRGASFSADGSQLLMTSDESGVFNAHAIDLASGETSQLTRSTSDAIFTQGWFPDDNRFLYSADQGGNDALDSDANPVSGYTFIFELSAGQSDVTWDAGLVAELGTAIFADGFESGDVTVWSSSVP